MIFIFRLLRNWLVILLWVTLVSCSNRIEITDVIDNPVKNTPLVISISFASGISADAYVEYWEAGMDNHKASVVSKSSLAHHITLTGLKSDRDYHYKVIVRNNGEEISSEVYSFKTNVLPEDLPRFNLVADNKCI